MKKLSFYLFALLLVGVVFTGCKDEETTPEVDPVQVLKDYLVSTDMDLNHVLMSADDMKFVTGAPATEAEIAAFVEARYVMDIRSAADFALGHIDGANNVAFADILTAADAADKKILVVCYTGQTACYATSLLRLYGHQDAQALKWGMSGWNADDDKWTANVGGDYADGHTNWSYEAAPTNQTYEAATFSSTLEDGQSILNERIEAIVAGGFKTASGTAVIDAPGDYFINNYFSEVDYLAFGHIDGAVRINPGVGITDDAILGLDPNKPVVTYCYTGQTSAVITAFLNVLGYDAYSLSFGTNGLFNSNAAWTTNQWGGDSNPKNYPTVASK